MTCDTPHIIGMVASTYEPVNIEESIVLACLSDYTSSGTITCTTVTNMDGVIIPEWDGLQNLLPCPCMSVYIN